MALLWCFISNERPTDDVVDAIAIPTLGFLEDLAGYRDSSANRQATNEMTRARPSAPCSELGAIAEFKALASFLAIFDDGVAGLPGSSTMPRVRQ